MTDHANHASAFAARNPTAAVAAFWQVVTLSTGLALSTVTPAQVMPPPAANAPAAPPAATATPESQAVQMTQGKLLQAQTPVPEAAPGQVLTPASADGKTSVARLSRTSPLDRRMQVLTKELNLDPKQQAQIRKILESQRDAVRKIWSDPAVLPPERTAATQAQAEHAGDAIRAVLNEEQQKLYNRSRADNPLPPGDKRSVEQWMDAAKGKTPTTP